MSYENSKIYKLECDDGHYYFGSTRGELNRRFHEHKQASSRQTYRVYQHINSIGWEKVSIILVEALRCSNRKELLQKESEYISASITDSMCLNTKLSFITEDERREKNRTLNEKYKDKLAAYHKEKRTGNSDVAEYQRQYRERNKEKLTLDKKAYHEKNKEDANKKKLENYYANRDEILRRKREKYNQQTNQIDRTVRR